MFALRIAKQEITNTVSLSDTIEAQLAAESELEILKFYAASGEFISNAIRNNALTHTALGYPEFLYIDNREYNITSNITFQLQDTAGLLNTSENEVMVLTNLLDTAKKADNRQTIRDSIIDWMDQDDFHGLNGAESDYYQQRGASYLPRNVPFLASKDELRLVRGIRDISEEEWKHLKKFFVYCPSSEFNIATAPIELLAARVGINPQELNGYEELRKRNLGLFMQEISEKRYFNMENMGNTPSGVVAITIIAKKNNARAALETLIDFGQREDAPLHTISRY